MVAGNQPAMATGIWGVYRTMTKANVVIGNGVYATGILREALIATWVLYYLYLFF